MKFKNKIKVLHFIGYGEPLLHKEICKFIRYAKDKNVAEVIDFVTNGSLLNDSLVDGLIQSGLDKIRISLQGLDATAYMRTSNIHINYEQLKDNIRKLKQKRDVAKSNLKIYIKIIDVALGNYLEKDFEEAFSSLCDYIAVEHLYKSMAHVKENYAEYDSSNKTVNGATKQDIEVCPYPFYSLMVNPDGNCVPCCNPQTPLILGNCKC